MAAMVSSLCQFMGTTFTFPAGTGEGPGRPAGNGFQPLQPGLCGPLGELSDIVLEYFTILIPEQPDGDLCIRVTEIFSD